MTGLSAGRACRQTSPGRHLSDRSLTVLTLRKPAMLQRRAYGAQSEAFSQICVRGAICRGALIDLFLQSQNLEILRRVVLRCPALAPGIHGVLAQRFDTAAARPPVRRAGPDQAPVGFAGLAAVKAAISIKPDAGGVRFDKRLAHRKPPVFGRMVDQPVAIEHGPSPILIAKNDEPRILAGDVRIEPPKIGIDLVGEPKEKGENIEEMHRRLMNEETLHGLEIGLPVEIGIRAAPVAGPKREADLVDAAKRAFIDDLFQLPVPGLEAEIVMHNQVHPPLPPARPSGAPQKDRRRTASGR